MEAPWEVMVEVAVLGEVAVGEMAVEEEVVEMEVEVEVDARCAMLSLHDHVFLQRLLELSVLARNDIFCFYRQLKPPFLFFLFFHFHQAWTNKFGTHDGPITIMHMHRSCIADL